MSKSVYQDLSTEALEQMLRDMTAAAEALDMERMDAILAELNSRQGAPETMSPQEALHIFETEYSGTESAYLDCAYEEPTKEH